MQKINILIVGAGAAGRELLTQLIKYFSNRYEIIGFLDDDQKLQGRKVGGIKVLGKIDDLPSQVKKYQVEEVLIAIPSAKGFLIRKVINECQKERVRFKIIPRILEIVEGKVKISQVRDIEPGDLLGRAIVKSEQDILKREFEGKVVMVTGGAGSIGSELCRQLVQFNPKKLIVFDSWESGLFNLELDLSDLAGKRKFECTVGNIQDVDRLEEVISTFKPQIIFHAAAYKHVPLMQRYPFEAVKNNVFGTLNVVKMASRYKIGRFINISTDKAVDPSSLMGTSKLIGEMIVSKFNGRGTTKFCSVRFGNVLGSQGSVIPTFKKQITKGGPVTVTNKSMTRYFMTIPEASQLVLNASHLIEDGGKVFVLDMGEPVKIDELARLMISLAGFIPDNEIKIKYIGIRPGEKLHERLSQNFEKMERTSNSKIFLVKETNKSINIEKYLNELSVVVKENNPKKLFNLLRKVAPHLKEMR